MDSLAKNELKNIFNYYRKKVSVEIAKKIIRQLIEKANKLKNFPESGAIEVLLHERPQQFIVITNYKIIYWINEAESRIEVVDIFDTRQTPDKIDRN